MTQITRVGLLAALIGGPVFGAVVLYADSVGSRALHYAAYLALPIATMIAINIDRWWTQRRGEANEPVRPSDWHG